MENISSQSGLHQVIMNLHIYNHLGLHVFIWYSLPYQIWLPNQVSIHFYILILITRSNTFNLSIRYPSTYFGDDWHYRDAITYFIRRAIDMLDWDRAFVNTNVNEKVLFLTKLFWTYFLLHSIRNINRWFSKK